MFILHSVLTSPALYSFHFPLLIAPVMIPGVGLYSMLYTNSVLTASALAKIVSYYKSIIEVFNKKRRESMCRHLIDAVQVSKLRKSLLVSAGRVQQRRQPVYHVHHLAAAVPAFFPISR